MNTEKGEKIMSNAPSKELETTITLPPCFRICSSFDVKDVPPKLEYYYQFPVNNVSLHGNCVIKSLVADPGRKIFYLVI